MTVDFYGWNRKEETMNFLNRLASRFTAHGRALAEVTKGRDCANKGESGNAIKYDTDVINTSETPRDVIAMALFNRALVYTTIRKVRRATEDLKAVLGMPETITMIKKSASNKLVRMQRKLDREESSTSDA